jgi:hypothetical protein
VILYPGDVLVAEESEMCREKYFCHNTLTKYSIHLTQLNS